jgi:hypothetical protein
VSTDGRDRRFLVGAVDSEAGENVEGVLPVCAGLLRFKQGVVGMSESVVRAGLVVGLAQFRGEGKGLVVVSDRGVRVSSGVMQAAEALPCFELIVAVAAVLGEVEQPLVVVGGLLVPALYPMDDTEAVERGLFGVAVAGGAGGRRVRGP